MEQGHFADRLCAAVSEKESRVVVGLDPRVERIPQALQPADRNDPRQVAQAFFRFNRLVIDAVADLVVGVKPQFAFYECYGPAGLECLQLTIAYARNRGLLVIGDGKRNDIGSTAAAYAQAYLGDGPLAVDALTVNPYLGSDGIQLFLDQAVKNQRGLFVLVRTSNPSAQDIQDLQVSDTRRRLFEEVALRVAQWGENFIGSSGYSLVGAVCGATYPADLSLLRQLMPKTPFLVPGFGAQGAGAVDVKGAFSSGGQGAVVNASRSIIFAFDREDSCSDPAEAIRSAAAAMRRSINDVLR